MNCMIIWIENVGYMERCADEGDKNRRRRMQDKRRRGDCMKEEDRVLLGRGRGRQEGKKQEGGMAKMRYC